jgi:hypothetical protein
MNVIISIAAIAAFFAFSTTIFGVMGKTAEDSSWYYAMALYATLAIAGFTSGIINLTKINSLIERINKIISSFFNGLSIGFFYGGISSNNNPKVAIFTAISLGIFFSIGIVKFKQRSIAIISITIGAIAAYGFAFVAGNYAGSCLSTQHFVLGILWAIASLLYIWLTMRCLTAIANEINNATEI